MVAVEFAVHDPDSVETIARVKPDRIELCAALPLGGLTPSAAFIQQAVATGVPVHVLVRPRPGAFEYSSSEYQVIVDDTHVAFDAGATGVVVGGTRGDAVDTELMTRVCAVAEGRCVTFHRAFDVISDWQATLKILIDLGVNRVLTSGGASSAVDGQERLRACVQAAERHIEIMAGGGVTAETVAEVIATGVDAVHASAKRDIPDPLPVSLGSNADVLTRQSFNEDEALRLLALVHNIAPGTVS